MRRGLRGGLALLAMATIAAGAAPASAQTATVPPGAVVQPMTPDRGAELRGYLTTLAENPQSLEALIGAGRAALEMGDAEAALNFFGRADQVSPRDARVKAGMASTLVELGQPQPALRLFSEAAALGAPEAEIAAERGLAYDLVGEPRRAQQDFLAALRRREDPEVRRRLALSLAISGQREAALHLIEPQLRHNDRAAWRTQAFVLALTGDANAADRTVQSMMPAGAQEMAPFLARLHGLSPAEKAMAVHLGRFPTNGSSHVQVAHAEVSPDPAAVAFALGRPAATTATRTASAHAPVATTRHRPSRRSEPRLASAEDARATSRTTGSASRSTAPAPAIDSSDPYGLRGRRRIAGGAQAAVRPQPSRDETLAPPVEPRPVATAERSTRWQGAPYPDTGESAAATVEPPVQATPPPPVAVQPPPAAVQPPPAATQPSPQMPGQPAAPADMPIAQAAPPSQTAPAQAAAGAEMPALTPTTSQPPSSLPQSPTPSASAPADTASPASPPAVGTSAPVSSITEVALPPASPPPPPQQAEQPAASSSGISDIAAVVNALPQETRPALPQPSTNRVTPPSQPTRVAAARRTEPRATRTRPPAAPPNPSRHWVQIATGAARAALPREFARLQALAPDQLRRRTAFTVPMRATNRLLVGPFASEDEAQAFVNELRHRNVPALAWTSAAGQEIERLQTGR